MYRDFFQFTPPATGLVYFVLFKLLGPRAWIPNTVLLVMGLALAWLSVVISRKVMRGWVVFLPGLLFLPFMFRSFLDPTHHWFSVPAVMGAIALVIEKRSLARLAGAGALCGLASCFTQPRGMAALLGLVVFLVWESRKKRQAARELLRVGACLFSTFLAAVVAVNAYFVWKAGLQRFLYCTVVAGVKYYSADSRWNTFRVYLSEAPILPPWYRLPHLAVYLFPHFLLPLVYVVFLMHYRREASGRPLERWDRLMLLNLTGLFLFLSIAPAPGWGRLCMASLPGLILLVWFLDLPGKFRRPLLGSLWVAGLTLVVAECLYSQNRWAGYLDTPAGRTAFTHPMSYETMKWVLSKTQPGEFIFAGDSFAIYFALGLRDPSEITYITPNDYTRPEQVQNVINSLEKRHVRYVLWDWYLDSSGVRSSPGDHLNPLRAYLRRHYRVIKSFEDSEQVWERKTEPSN